MINKVCTMMPANSKIKQFTTPSIKHPKIIFLIFFLIKKIHLDSICMQEFIYLLVFELIELIRMDKIDKLERF
jgi:hypothetical protein